MEIIDEQRKLVFSWGISYGSQPGPKCEMSAQCFSEIAHMEDPSFPQDTSSVSTFASEMEGKGSRYFAVFVSAKVFFPVLHLDLIEYFENSPRYLVVPQMKPCDKCFPIPIKGNCLPRDLEDENIFLQDDTKQKC